MDAVAILNAATAAAQALNALLPLLSSDNKDLVLAMVQQADRTADQTHEQARGV